MQINELRELAIDELQQALMHPRSRSAERVIDTLKAYIIACTEHDDASRHDPEGL